MTLSKLVCRILLGWLIKARLSSFLSDWPRRLLRRISGISELTGEVCRQRREGLWSNHANGFELRRGDLHVGTFCSVHLLAQSWLLSCGVLCWCSPLGAEWSQVSADCATQTVPDVSSCSATGRVSSSCVTR